MELFKRRWARVPRGVRRPIVFIVGTLFIIAAGLTGWLPGPGGIPLFLIGIAILSTEFEWAKKVRDAVVDGIHQAGKLFRAHKVLGTIIIVVAAATAVALSVYIYRRF